MSATHVNCLHSLQSSIIQWPIHELQFLNLIGRLSHCLHWFPLQFADLHHFRCLYLLLSWHKLYVRLRCLESFKWSLRLRYWILGVNMFNIRFNFDTRIDILNIRVLFEIRTRVHFVTHGLWFHIKILLLLVLHDYRFLLLVDYFGVSVIQQV